LFVVTVAFAVVFLLKLSGFKLHIGTGKGGTSIWGKKFEDEFHESLRVCILFAVIPVLLRPKSCHVAGRFCAFVFIQLQ